MVTENLQRFDSFGRPTLIAWFDDFEGPNNFRALSNFYKGLPIHIPEFNSDMFDTGEHAYQALKAWNGPTVEYEQIRDAESPGEAKVLGNQCQLRPDWELVKYDVMMAVLRAKFDAERSEGQILLATGDALLVEGTFWGDRVWGIDLDHDLLPLFAPGRNWLGTMLMARRAEIKAEMRFGHIHKTGTYNAEFATDWQE